MVYNQSFFVSLPKKELLNCMENMLIYENKLKHEKSKKK